VKRQYIIAAAMVVVATVLAVSLGAHRPVQAAGPVLAGYDLLETDSSTTYQDLTNLVLPGCAPYTGRIHFEGVPFDTFGLNTGLSPTDTIVQRLATAGPTFPASIPVKIAKLSLKSIDNIVVACADGTEVWNMKAEVPEGDLNQTNGKMTIRHEFADCGTFDVTLPVKPKITFTQKGNNPGPPIVIDTLSSPVITFASTNNIWCDNVSNPLLIPPGDTVVQIPGLTTNFFPGAENVPNKGTVKHVTQEEAQNAAHGIRPAERRPALGGVAEYPNLGSGGNAWLLAGALVAAVALVLSGAGWYVRRRWL
jgi:hypothetical protein